MAIKGELIKERLLSEISTSHIKQPQLAEMVWVSKSVFSEYKTTKKLPSLETFAKICEVLDLDANYVLGLKDI